MPEDQRATWAKMLQRAQRLAMVHSLADRHEEAEKMKRLVEELLSVGKARGWPAPEEIPDQH